MSDIKSGIAIDGNATLRGARVEPAEWADPEERDIRGAKRVRGLRVVSQIEKLHRDQPKTFTARYVSCARKFVEEWEMSENKVSVGDGVKVDSAASDGISTRQLNAIASNRMTRRSIGPSAAVILDKVLIGNATIARLAVYLGINPMNASGRLSAALQRLQEHYDALPGAGKRAIPIGAGVERGRSGAVQINDTGLSDDRIGRWRV